MALPTNGRVIVETTAGEIEIELWSKVIGCGLGSYKSTGVDIVPWQETPKTCRNFLALAMEGA
jgi:peptidyl-prolyl cis-trans isomerase SDCCAG10